MVRAKEKTPLGGRPEGLWETLCDAEAKTCSWPDGDDLKEPLNVTTVEYRRKMSASRQTRGRRRKPNAPKEYLARSTRSWINRRKLIVLPGRKL
jgi:hypothetical protein